MLEEENCIVKHREDRTGDNVDKGELSGNKENSCIVSNGEMDKCHQTQKAESEIHYLCWVTK